MIIRRCKKCSAKFCSKPSHIKMGWGIYCSNRCHYMDVRKRITKTCHICDKNIYKTMSQLKNSKSKKYFCSKSCQTKWRNTVFVGEKHTDWKKGEAVNYRKMLFDSTRQKFCESCKLRDTRVLAAHHVDGNRKNNKLKNLIWLCHNCHHEVHYGSLGMSGLLKIKK